MLPMTMRIFAGTSLSLLVIATGCSSSSTTVANGDGGDSTNANGGATSKAGSSGSSVTAAGGATSAAAGATSAAAGATSAAAGASNVGGVGRSGGNSAAAGASLATGIGGTLIASGGSVIDGGTSGQGMGIGGAATAGRDALGGTTSLFAGAGGVVATGGAVVSGGAQAAGAAPTAVGGMVVTGGKPATGGTPATGGIPQTVCTGATPTSCAGICADLQTDKSNCGACGHGCGGGTCAGGLCQAAVLGSAPSPASPAYPVLVFYVDATYVYYHSDGVERYREPKADLGGIGTHLVTGSYLSNFSVVGSTLYWNLGTTIGYCDAANCSTTQAGSAEGSVVANTSSTTTNVASVNSSCMYSSSFCLDWRSVDTSTVARAYEDLYTIPSEGSSTFTSFIASGPLVYWIASDYNSSNTFLKASLFSVDSTALNRAQLAGGLTESTRILDVNSLSVILADASSNLYRVSLPLGLGSGTPQAIGVQGVAATEDASNLFWIDSMGTVYSCDRSNCTGTIAVRANGQQYAGRILQDSTAVYWGRANPAQVMRLAK